MLHTVDNHEVARVRPPARFIFLTDQEPRRSRYEAVSPFDRVAWRVVAANNRPLGRSTRAFGALDECYDSALTLHMAADEVSIAVLFSSADGHWRWRVSLNGEPIAEQVHLYKRRIEANRAVTLFLGAARAVRPEIADLRQSGRRSMLIYDRADGRVSGG